MAAGGALGSGIRATQMRSLIFLAFILCAGCAERQVLHVSCSEPYSPSFESVKVRVLAAHPLLSADEVLDCLSLEGSGLSSQPDQEACIVRFEPAKNENRIRSYWQRPINAPPVVVSILARKVPPLVSSRSLVSPLREDRGPVVFETDDPATVVMYAPHARCSALEEVT